MLIRASLLVVMLAGCSGMISDYDGTSTDGGAVRLDAGFRDAGSSGCVFVGVSVAEGQSVSAYVASMVSAGQSCVSESRTCRGGALTGTFVYRTCTTASESECVFNGAPVTTGSKVTAYQSATVPAGSSCVSEERTCSQGVLSGSFTVASCAVAPATDCTFNGGAVTNGNSVTAYQAATVPFGQTCTSESRVCTNGVLSGSYTVASCAATPAADCSFNGAPVTNGTTVTAFQAAAVPFGQTCTSQTRSCANGVLSGTFTDASCAVTPAADCSFNGAKVAHAASVTAFQAPLVAYGQTCTSQSRTCTDGPLSGSFTSAACTVDSLHYADLTSGTWTIACQAGNGYASYQSRFTAGTEGYVEVLWTFWDSTCTTVLYRDYQIQKITELVEWPDPAGTGTTFTWRYDRQEDGAQPMQSAITDAFNSNMSCGHTGWATGTYYKHVAPTICGPTVQYWMVRIERTGTVQSVFAPDLSTGSGASPITRPIAVDRRAAYTRTLDLSSTGPNPMMPGSLRPQ